MKEILSVFIYLESGTYLKGIATYLQTSLSQMSLSINKDFSLIRLTLNLDINSTIRTLISLITIYPSYITINIKVST